VHAGARIPGGPVVVEILQRVVEGRVVFGSDDDVARCVRVHVGPGAIPRQATGRPACSRPPSAATSPERSARRPGRPAPCHEPTLAGFKHKVAYFKTVFPDLEEDLQDIIASGDTVATRWVTTGSLQQEFMGIPASGQRIRIEGMNFYRLKDGRVTDIWTRFDSVALMQQLGAIPA
jgi:steroid delta-isomerase-like uncharacterized protein